MHFQDEKDSEIISLYVVMVNRYGAPFTDDILSRYTDIDVSALQAGSSL